MGKYSSKKTKKSKKSSSSGLSVALALVLLIAVLAGIWFFLSGPGFKVPQENVSLGGIHLDGMSREEATDALNTLDEQFHTTSMVITAGDHSVELSPEESGADLDVETAVEDIFDKDSLFDSTDLSNYLTLNQDAVQDAVADLAELVQQDLEETSYYVEGDDPAQGQTLYVTVGTPGCSLDSDALYNAVIAAYYSADFYTEGECDTTEPEDIDFASVLEEYTVAPVDAHMDESGESAIPDKPGYAFSLEELNQLLSDAGYGETVSLAIETIEAEITKNDILGTIYPDILASHSTPYTLGDEDRNTNLRLACEAIDGMVLEPGDVFSYNEALGERTAERGYRPGASYENGKVVTTYGGGICQVSSTLYYCAMLSDFQIIERHCHMFIPDYIDYGMDATVSWGALDFQFRNNTDYPVRISADMSDGFVNVTIHGTDTKDYYVDMDYYIEAVYDYDTVYEYYSADNEEGYYHGQTIVAPVLGYGIDTYRCKYSKATDELISEEYEAYSDYDHRDAVICQIVGAEDSDDSNDSDDTSSSYDDYYVGSGGGISPDGG